MPCWPTPDVRACASVSCRRGWWSTTSWPWRCTPRPPTARCCAACWRACAGCICGGAEPGLGRASRRSPRPGIRLGAGSARRTVRARRPAAGRAGHCRAPGTGAAGWSAWTAPPSTCPTPRTWSSASAGRRLARRERLSPAAPAGADRDRHARDLRRRLRPLSTSARSRLARRLLRAACGPACCAWPTAPSSASSCGATAAATGADLLWRLRGNQVLPCRRAPARRLVPEPPLSLAQAPPP